LQEYAGRGVFRGFRATPGPRGRVEYQFTWLFRRPMRAVFNPRRRTLTFAALFPGAGASKPMSGGLKTLAGSRGRNDQPAHKRIDARRARVTSTMRQGDLSLAIHVRGANYEYAVRRVLNLINELFISLHDEYPDYLIERFGLSTE